DPFAGQPAGLGHAVVHVAAAQRTPDQGDGAVVAAVVAALRDLEVGVVGRGADDPLAPQGKVPLGAVGLQLFAPGHPGGDLVDDAVGGAAHHRVHLGDLGADLAAVALGQAAGDHHLQIRVLLLIAARLQNVLDGLSLGALDKAAGVHQHHVGVGNVGHR